MGTKTIARESLVNQMRRNRVLGWRFGLNGAKVLTLEQVGAALGVTRERARQIEREALSLLPAWERRLLLKTRRERKSATELRRKAKHLRSELKAYLRALPVCTPDLGALPKQFSELGTPPLTGGDALDWLYEHHRVIRACRRRRCARCGTWKELAAYQTTATYCRDCETVRHVDRFRTRYGEDEAFRAKVSEYNRQYRTKRKAAGRRGGVAL